jgi:4-alpha-glucanotransferase
MQIDIFLRFSTLPGQTLKIFGNTSAWNGNEPEHALPMQYLDLNHWHFKLNLNEHDLEQTDALNYSFLFQTEHGELISDWNKVRFIKLSDLRDGIRILDTWMHMGDTDNALKTLPFKSVFAARNAGVLQVSEDKSAYITFSVDAPLLSPDEKLALIGSDKLMGEWDKNKLIPMYFDGHLWQVQIHGNLVGESLQYKYCLTDSTGKFIRFENGENRLLNLPSGINKVDFIRDGFVNLGKQWRGTGVAVPVFSLRTKNSLGVGEFNDIKPLVDWAKSVSIRMIQILPVNDTTSTHTRADSYPYAAISAFALHPLYISLDSVAGKKYTKYIKTQLASAAKLNDSVGVAYEEIMNLKWESLGILYPLMKEDVFKSTDYKLFFEENKSWLIPYAAFSYLRDHIGQPGKTDWGKYANFNDAVIADLCTPGTSAYDQVALHFFIQYHLHLQLKEAHDYANSHGVILKGDIAIGVHKFGADTWTQPSLYNLNKQAGAPPDDFAVKGQNWGFPTYNWEVMKADGFSWWKQRFTQMSNYFDAFRIDHILGFFRIWSIPEDAIEGIMGKFVPAIPVYKHEFESRGIHFNAERFCEPFITDQIIWELAPGLEQKIKAFLKHKSNFQYQFRDEFNTQKKIEHYLNAQQQSEDSTALRQALFNLQSNVLLWRDEVSDEGFHFRFNIDKTLSYIHLSNQEKYHFTALYNDYFFNRQDQIWRKEALEKLPALKRCTEMLICGEDLGLVPKTVPEVMANLGLLSMEVQRMPKQMNQAFFDPANAPYLSVVTPSTHDMSTIREWWTENANLSQKFFNEMLWQYGEAPADASCQIVRAIILQHLNSPAMWAVFQLQDLFAMQEDLRLSDPKDERINVPGDPNHFWRFRIQITLEDLLEKTNFNNELKTYINSCDRSCLA